MAIKATLSSGITSTKTQSLFQWDYGQQLEIVSDDLPSIIEVHFACKGMSEAVVIPCSVTDGTGIVPIPDACLEQANDITAWVYAIDGTQGKTMKTITIPIVSRIRPGRSETIPQVIHDTYTELISQINDAIGDLRNGTVIVKKAETAELATKAGHATNASFANDANWAASAGAADTADMATGDSFGTSISDAYFSKSREWKSYNGMKIQNGIYSVTVRTYASSGNAVNFIVDIDHDQYSPLFLMPVYYFDSGNTYSRLLRVHFVTENEDYFHMELENIDISNGSATLIKSDDYVIRYQCLTSPHALG